MRSFADVKALTENESLVQHRRTGKIGTVLKVLMKENCFTVRYITDGKIEGFCEPKDFYLIRPAVKGTIPRGSMS